MFRLSSSASTRYVVQAALVFLANAATASARAEVAAGAADDIGQRPMFGVAKPSAFNSTTGREARLLDVGEDHQVLRYAQLAEAVRPARSATVSIWSDVASRRHVVSSATGRRRRGHLVREHVALGPVRKARLSATAERNPASSPASVDTAGIEERGKPRDFLSARSRGHPSDAPIRRRRARNTSSVILTRI